MSGKQLPSLYEIYTNGGYHSGLETRDQRFLLNGKPFQIISGTIHYFRVIPEYWEDRLIKMKACGLNTVDTYVPWNLHEELPGQFNFKDGLLNLPAFLCAVKKADMFVILRPGPYICAEWEFGGLPSWLLHDNNMKIRSNYEPYKKAVKQYFTHLARVIKDFQFSSNFGPIIAMQIENEFSEYCSPQNDPNDLEYMQFLKKTMESLGLNEFFFTSDMPSQGILPGSIPGVLIAGNFQTDVTKELSILRKHQPNEPLLIAEFWSGWYDHWEEEHSKHSLENYEQALREILKNNASVNMYVFHGGTNFGFLNGANEGFPNANSPYLPTVTSYDYDAPLTESGDYTPKYYKTKDIIDEISHKIPFQCLIPAMPPMSEKMRMNDIAVTSVLSLNDILKYVNKLEINNVQPMELLNIHNGYGQNFGMILYRTEINSAGNLSLQGGFADRAIIMLDGIQFSVLDWKKNCRNVLITTLKEGTHTLDILVENLGRVNYGLPEKLNNQRKGLWDPVKLNDKELHNWSVYPLEFGTAFINSLNTVIWKEESNTTSALYKVELDVCFEPKDSFLFSKTWNKGIAFVNGFNLGRYWTVGPQQTLYLPGPLLKRGKNYIYIFELHQCIKSIDLLDTPILNELK